MRTAPLRTWLVILGAWAAVVPYIATLLGLDVDVAGAVEVVDHVLPGIATIGLALAADRLRGTARDLALGGCALCGFWITATHLPLLADGGDAARPWDAVLVHATAGLPLLIVALLAFLGPRSVA